MTFRDPDLGRDRTTAALGTEGLGLVRGQRDGGSRRSRSRRRRRGAAPAMSPPMTASTAPWASPNAVSRCGPSRPCRWVRPTRRSAPNSCAMNCWPNRWRPVRGPTLHAPRRCSPRWPPRSTDATAKPRRPVWRRRRGGTVSSPRVALELAGGVGAVIAQTSHRPAAAVPGAPRLNTLAGARLPEALQLFLARDQIRQAQALSDPDLPRLWMLANGLAHGTPVTIMRRVPGRSAGPAARVAPLHDDLLDWRGMRVAVEHMTATVAAAREGRSWLDRSGSFTGVDAAALAVGVVSLTNPKSAAAMARHGLAHVTVERARAAAGAPPAGVLDLSDGALKAVCDRNGWLLGAPSERTQRELVQRELPPDAGDTLRARLAAGDGDALENAITAAASDDAALDRRAFRKNPPASDVAAIQRLLRAAGTEALSRFAGFETQPRESFAEAFAHRFPAQLSRGPLAESDPQQLLQPDPVLPAVHQHRADPLRFDLGL